jgi:hypothetical protein
MLRNLLNLLTAYGHVTEPVYYAMRFVDGLRDDIRSAVSLHRLVSFDTAASLSLLQEDVGVALRPSRKSDAYFTTKPASRGAHPLPPPQELTSKQHLFFMKKRKCVKANLLKRGWQLLELIVVLRACVFVVLKSGAENTSVLRLFS